MSYPYNPYQMMNPYMERQPMFQQQNSFPSVRQVNDFAEVSANDVSMSAPFSVFVKNDMSELQIRKWNANGMIDNLTFKPVFEQRVDKPMATEEKLKYEPSDEFIQALNNRFDVLEKLLSENSTKVSTRKKVSDAE